MTNRENQAASRDRFISEAITPAPGAFDTAPMQHGDAGVPMRFSWRGTEYGVAEVVKAWHGHGHEGHVPDGELYLRKHWFTVRTTTGEQMTIYCDRAPRNPRRPKERWWLYTIAAPEPRDPPSTGPA